MTDVTPSIFSLEQLAVILQLAVHFVLHFVFISPFFITNWAVLVNSIFILLASIFVSILSAASFSSAKDTLTEGEQSKMQYLQSLKLQINQEINRIIDFCVICKVNTKIDSKHCKKCDFCMESFDHHCNWINNCIGGRNYKLFLFLISAALAFYTFSAILGVLVLNKYITMSTKELDEQFVNYAISAFSCFVTVMCIGVYDIIVMFNLIYLLCFHWYLRKNNMTTYSYLTRNDVSESSASDLKRPAKQRNKVKIEEALEKVSIGSKQEIKQIGDFIVFPNEMKKEAQEILEKIKSDTYGLNTVS